VFSGERSRINSGGQSHSRVACLHLSAAPAATAPTEKITNNGTITLSGGSLELKDFEGTGSVSQSGGTFRITTITNSRVDMRQRGYLPRERGHPAAAGGQHDRITSVLRCVAWT
jgi:hypothetical protein